MKSLGWGCTIVVVLLTNFAGQARSDSGAGGDVVLPAPAPVPDASRSIRLRTEIEQLEAERADIGLGGPAAAMVVGYILAPLILVGPLILAADDPECGGCRTTGLVVTGLGAAGLGVGIWGLAAVVQRSDKRVSIDRRIQSRRDELRTLAWDLKLGPTSVALSLQF